MRILFALEGWGTRVKWFKRVTRKEIHLDIHIDSESATIKFREFDFLCPLDDLKKAIAVLEKSDGLLYPKLTPGISRSLRWTDKQKEVRAMLERDASSKEILAAGYSKATLFRVKAALKREGTLRIG